MMTIGVFGQPAMFTPRGRTLRACILALVGLSPCFGADSFEVRPDNAPLAFDSASRNARVVARHVSIKDARRLHLAKSGEIYYVSGADLWRITLAPPSHDLVKPPGSEPESPTTP